MDEDITEQTLTHEKTVQKAMNQLLLDNNNYFFSRVPSMDLDLTFLHPLHAYIVKLWQIYPSSISPFLTVIYTPTLQASIVDAVNNIANIEPALEALLFGVLRCYLYLVSKQALSIRISDV